tara:strand:+ start:108 stop:569 length:462 start_codon:yes stop_codon:yes gene_type:complete
MTKEQIKKLVIENTGIDIDNPVRKRSFVEARAIYYKLLREYTLLSLVEIGDYVKKNHATVIHGIKNLDSWCELDVNLKNKYLNIRSGLDVLKENIELDNADIEKIVDRYIKLKQKASKLIESNKELLEQIKKLTNKYNEREKQLKKNGYIVTI